MCASHTPLLILAHDLPGKGWYFPYFAASKPHGPGRGGGRWSLSKLDLCELAGKASGGPPPEDGSRPWFSLCARPSLVWPVTLVCKTDRKVSGEIVPGKKKREREKRDRYQIGNEKADVMDPEDMKEIGRGCGGLNNDPGGTVRASSLEPMTLYGKGALQM